MFFYTKTLLAPESKYKSLSSGSGAAANGCVTDNRERHDGDCTVWQLSLWESFPPKAPSCNGRSTMECHNFVLLHSYLFVFDVSWMKDGCHITMMHQIREFNSPVVLSSLSLQLPHPDGSYDNSIQRYKENQVLVQACVFQMVSSGCWQCNVGANFTSIHQWREATFFLHVCSNGRWLIEK